MYLKKTSTFAERHFGRAPRRPIPTEYANTPTGWVWVEWENEHCHTCLRPVVNEHVWLDQELEAIFCEACQAKYKDHYLEEPTIEIRTPRLRPPSEEQRQLSLDAERHAKSVIGSLDYVEYRLTPLWTSRRDKYLASREQPITCDLCLESHQWTGTQHKAIEPVVHHTSYDNMGAEPDEDLSILCQRCHVLIHYPTVTAARAHRRRILKHRNEEAFDKAIYRLMPGTSTRTSVAHDPDQDIPF